MSGMLEYISDVIGIGHGHGKKKKQYRTVELKVRMDCDGCERKVKNVLSSLEGVSSVEINRKQQKVTVTGNIDEKKVLNKAKSTGKKCELWPYVPYNSVPQPFAAESYDKKAPPGHVRKVDSSVSQHTVNQERYTDMFSDENPNSCSIM